MALTPYQRLSHRMLRGVTSDAQSNTQLRLGLLRSHIRIRPEVYLATSWMTVLVTLVVSALGVGIVVLLSEFGPLALPRTALLLLLPIPFVLAFVAYISTVFLPGIRAANRARDIDAKLPYALNFMSAMASAGVTPERVFSALADQPIYGEVANEAAWITRDLRMLGLDLVTAMESAIDRSPSIKFQDLLQGAVSTVTSGESLKDYFLAKSEQYVESNRRDQKSFLEHLGILAESYVTVIVAAPLLVVILLTVMLMFGGNGYTLLRTGYLMFLILLPLAILGFGVTIKYLTPEA